ncbi:hypothetical protein [Actinoplanes derwentensis]|uniref:Cell division septum initiation DivIVA, interacts with FtsZ, MinD n=1 Tax=Actinoplanes derwentensis TaxID=113562 RepID=A0A1H2BWX6_9ACTN|nr:hypothetical protein [Actinoplanes derwentensis]GID83162.1 hypothetical protein Ade03nite_20860 [Actinoplanes derwentensis]SDT62567.1 hypothetical protein SAMN04489716_4967 [Actinoplanes derwentensis]
MNTDTEVMLSGGLDGVLVPAMPPAQRTTSVPSAETLVLPDGALQLLALAQRTADDHIAAVNRHAHQVRAEAQALAEQIHREAHAYADEARAETDRLLAETRAEADRLLTEARAEAGRIVADGSVHAEQMRAQAQQRYQDAVGGLAMQREALQKQIEALASFDNDYRQRITMFLQSQLRALWAEEPRAIDPMDPETHPAD